MEHERKNDAPRPYDGPDRRAKGSRIEADRIVARWIAGRMGLKGHEVEIYVQAILGAGFGDLLGRSGFDRIVRDLRPAGVNVEELRTRYFMAMSAVYMCDDGAQAMAMLDDAII
jgi:hypothetical protein